MKHIIKNSIPPELLDWQSKNGYYKVGHPKWKSISSALREIIRESMRNEQGYICCYCERYLQKDDYHIEHIKPKGDKSPYKHLLAEYDNMLCSCQAEGLKGDPLHCGMGKAGWYDPVNYISPLDPECEGRFKYTFNGHIEPADPTDAGAVMTIDQLKLYLPKLKALREATIEPFLDENLSPQELENFVSGYLVEKELNDGRYNEFYTTIKFLFK